MRVLVFLLGAACALAGCDSSGPIAGTTPAQAEYQRQADAALAAVDAAIGEARADAAASCRLLPLGVNNAGGATFYRVYSITDSDPALLERLAARVAEIDRQALADGVRDYPYPTPPPPAVELRDGRCLFVPIAID